MAVTNYSGRRGGSASPSGNNAIWIAGAVAVVVVLLIVIGIAGASGGASGASSNKEAKQATKQSAVDAATQYEVLFQTFDVRYPDTGADRLLELASEQYEPILEEEIIQITNASGSGEFASARREGLPYVAAATPISYVVERFEGNRAAVVIWSSTLAGIKTKAAPRIGFVRSRVALAFDGERWLVTNHEALKPIVPYISTADGATRDAEYYERQQGAEFYEGGALYEGR